jgi:hypothetical protein
LRDRPRIADETKGHQPRRLPAVVIPLSPGGIECSGEVLFIRHGRGCNQMRDREISGPDRMVMAQIDVWWSSTLLRWRRWHRPGGHFAETNRATNVYNFAVTLNGGMPQTARVVTVRLTVSASGVEQR